MEFFQPQGQDGIYYQTLGHTCAASGFCWDPLRPMGIIYWMSVPFRMGWRPESLIGMTLVVMLLAAWMLSRSLPRLLPGPSAQGMGPAALRFVAVSLPLLAFMWGAAHHPISDVPSACIGLLGLAVLVQGWEKRSLWRLGLAGLLLGTCAIVRIFYLYPFYIFAGCLALMGPWSQRLGLSAAALLALAAAFPIGMQYASTHKNVGAWAPLDPNTGNGYEREFLDAPVVAADGLGCCEMREYPCTGCLHGPGGWVSALKRGDLSGLVTFLVARQNFYLGSYAMLPCLNKLEDRIFSRWILLANLAALAGFLYVGFVSPHRWLFLAALSFVAASWAEASLIRPEGRFMMLPLTWIWAVALLELLRRFGPQPAPRTELP